MHIPTHSTSKESGRGADRGGAAPEEKTSICFRNCDPPLRFRIPMMNLASAKPRIALMALAALGALSGAACQKAQLAQVLPPGAHVDLFPQSSQAQLDAIFVVDDSKYMAIHQARVAASFGKFLAWLDKNQVDYHLGLLSSDVPSSAGVYLGGGADHFFSGAEAQQLPAAVTALGGNGSAISAVLQQMDLAIKGPPMNFLRPGASLFLVIVTDDNDPWSAGPDLYYYRSFKSAKGPGGTGITTLSVLAGDNPGGCSIPDPSNPSHSFVASPAPRLIGVATEMGGTFHSLCDPDFDAVFDSLGAQAAGLKKAFRLTSVPAPATIKVDILATCDTLPAALNFCTTATNNCAAAGSIDCVPPQSATNGWSFDPTANSIVFNGTALPPRASQIEVTYEQPDAGVLQ